MLRPELPWRVLSVAVVLGLVPTVLWRRTRPLAMVAVAFGTTGLVSVATGGVAPEMYATGYLLLLPYALFRWGSGREVGIGSLIILANLAVSIAFGRLSLADTVGGAAVLLAAVALGAAFRFRAGSRARELDQVKLLERERLGRDLHDTVAHHVSAIAIRSQAGRAAAQTQPDAAADALRVVEAEASRALAELRTLVRVLRHGQPADVAPSPRITDLTQLAGQDRAGPPVEVDIVGDADDVSSPVATAVTGWPRRRSPTRGGTPGTRPGSTFESPSATRQCSCE